jgi:hypothetical protein
MINMLNDQMTSNGGRTKPTPQEGFKDTWAVVLFAVNVFAIVAIAGMWGPAALRGDSVAESNATPAPTPALAADDSLTTAELNTIISICGASVFVGGFLSIVAIKALLRAGGAMIKCAMIITIVVLLIFAVIAFAVNFILAIILLVIAAINICYFYCVRNRIPFAAANLSVACKAVKTHSSVLCVSYTMMVVQFVWIMLWAIAFIGIVHHKQQQKYEALQKQSAAGIEACNSIYEVTCGESSPTNAQCHVGYTCTGSSKKSGRTRTTEYSCTCDNAVGVSSAEYYFLLVCFYWGMQVVKNVTHTTVCGTVASWWFQGTDAQPCSNASSGAFKRATTTSFGSICLGSLIVAIVRALEQMARQYSNEEGGALACVAECLLTYLRQLIEYFNKWAFAYVGIYGYDFVTAGKSVIALFKERGWTAIINDDLVDNALSLASLGVGAACAVLGGVAVLFTDAADGPNSSTVYQISALLSFLVGLSMSGIVMSNIESSVATIFVCWAEDPIALMNNHPQEHYTIAKAWHEFWPEEMSFQPQDEVQGNAGGPQMAVAYAIPLQQPQPGMATGQAIPMAQVSGGSNQPMGQPVVGMALAQPMGAGEKYNVQQV